MPEVSKNGEVGRYRQMSTAEMRAKLQKEIVNYNTIKGNLEDCKVAFSKAEEAKAEGYSGSIKTLLSQIETALFDSHVRLYELQTELDSLNERESA